VQQRRERRAKKYRSASCAESCEATPLHASHFGKTGGVSADGITVGCAGGGGGGGGLEGPMPTVGGLLLQLASMRAAASSAPMNGGGGGGGGGGFEGPMFMPRA